MKKIPVLSMANFGQYVQMLHYMLFQEEIQRQEFQFQTVIEDGKNIYHTWATRWTRTVAGIPRMWSAST